MRLVVLLVIIIVNSRRGSGGGTGRVGGLSADCRRIQPLVTDVPGITKTMVWQPWALLGLQKQWFGSFGRSWAYKNNGLGALEASNATIVTPDAFEASSFRIPYGSPNGFTKGILTKGFT